MCDDKTLISSQLEWRQQTETERSPIPSPAAAVLLPVLQWMIYNKHSKVMKDPRLIKVYGANLACAPSANRTLWHCIVAAHGYTPAIWVYAKCSTLLMPVSVMLLLISCYLTFCLQYMSPMCKNRRAVHCNWLTKQSNIRSYAIGCSGEKHGEGKLKLFI